MSNVNEKNILLTRAKSAVISRDFVTAARLYKQLLKTDPSNVEYLTELGSIYVKSGEDTKAIPYYEQIITFYPHYVEAMNSLGAIYRRLKRYEDSINILQRALEEDRQVGSVNYNLGFTYKEMGCYDDAIEAFEIAINENPSDVLAYNHLGKIYAEEKEYQKAINSYKRGLGVDQNHPILNYNLAVCYDEAKMYSDAIRCYENALKAKPGWLEAIKDFSSLLIRCQKTKEAADIVQRSIELHPNDSRLLCLLGQIYLDQFDYSSAERTFRRAELLDENDIRILKGLGESLEKCERPEEALEPVLKALDISPDDLDLKKQYIHTLLSAKEYDAALINAQELELDQGSRDIELMDLYQQYYICTENEDKAKEYSNRIIKTNKHYKNHLLNAAERYSQIGKTDKAEQKAKEFIAREIRNPAGYNMLGKIYEEDGKIQEAIDSYGKSRNLKQPNILADKKINKLRGMLGEIQVNPPEDIPFYDEVEEDFEEEALIQEEVAADQIEEEETAEEDDDDFDFSQMGGSIPMEEALLEDETPFFDELDELTGKAEPAEETTDSEEASEDSSSVVMAASPMATPMMAMPGEMAAETVPSTSVPSPMSAPVSSPAPAYTPEPQIPNLPLNNSPSAALPQYDYRPRSAYEDQMQQSYAVETALGAQKRVDELEGEQKLLKERLASVENQQVEMKAEQKKQQRIAEFGMDTTPYEEDFYYEEGNNIPLEKDDSVTDFDNYLEAEDDAEAKKSFNYAEEIEEEKFSVPTSLEENGKASVKNLLPAIEKILSDEDKASVNEDKIGLFKKLLSLSNYLPDDEKNEFLSGKIRMQLEYLIAKMSGKPGLLKTSQSLIKSGILGDEVSVKTPNEDSVAQDYQAICGVLNTMKKLSEGLEDQYLAKALCQSADSIIQQISEE